MTPTPDRERKIIKVSRFLLRVLGVQEGSDVTPISEVKVKIHNFIMRLMTLDKEGGGRR